MKFMIATLLMFLLISKIGTYIGSRDCVDLFDGQLMCSDYGIVSYNDQDCLLLNNHIDNYLIFCPK